jgi:hypothetical protein
MSAADTTKIAADRRLAPVVLRALLLGLEIRRGEDRFCFGDREDGSPGELCLVGRREVAGQPHEDVLLAYEMTLGQFVRWCDELTEAEIVAISFQVTMEMERRKRERERENRTGEGSRPAGG